MAAARSLPFYSGGLLRGAAGESLRAAGAGRIASFLLICGIGWKSRNGKILLKYTAKGRTAAIEQRYPSHCREDSDFHRLEACASGRIKTGAPISQRPQLFGKVLSPNLPGDLPFPFATRMGLEPTTRRTGTNFPGWPTTIITPRLKQPAKYSIPSSKKQEIFGESQRSHWKSGEYHV